MKDDPSGFAEAPFLSLGAGRHAHPPLVLLLETPGTL
jgi:hypothetical protein